NPQSPGGISQSGNVLEMTAASSATGPVVAWTEQSGATRVIHVQRWNGTVWQVVGGGTVATATDISDLAIAIDGASIGVTWSQAGTASQDIFIKQLNGATWQEVAGSASGQGISNSSQRDYDPTIAWHGGQLFVAWTQEGVESSEQSSEIMARRFNGVTWEAIEFELGSTSAAASVIHSTQPRFVSGTSGLSIVWVEDLSRPDIADRDGIGRLRLPAG
ncbi:MAG: hypothetical protein IID15_07145, partial [Candidatus Marinimicrobia bacterium]|nr:hypothetical protein [Candidatus Neomarinimicrobiota bacterium]